MYQQLLGLLAEQEIRSSANCFPIYDQHCKAPIYFVLKSHFINITTYTVRSASNDNSVRMLFMCTACEKSKAREQAVTHICSFTEPSDFHISSQFLTVASNCAQLAEQ